MHTAREMPADTSLADAREAFAYWRTRRSQLRWYRRAARREASTLTARWRARLIRAHLERVGLELPAVVVEPLIGLFGRTRKDHARWLWRTVGRRTLLATRMLWIAAALAGAAMAMLAVLTVVAAWVLLS